MSYVRTPMLSLGANPLLDAASYEVTSAVERKVTDIFEKTVIPVAVGSAFLSIIALGLALAAYRRT